MMTADEDANWLLMTKRRGGAPTGAGQVKLCDGGGLLISVETCMKHGTTLLCVFNFGANDNLNFDKFDNTMVATVDKVTKRFDETQLQRPIPPI